MSDLTLVLTVHDEGIMAVVSARSLLAARAEATAAGLTSQVILVMDRPTAATRRALAPFIREEAPRVIETDFGDQGQARNAAVDAAEGAYVAFLDGDDLWSHNWLVAAHATCTADPGRVIAHPEVNWFFDGRAGAIFPPDMRDADFDPALLRSLNVYDALCMAPVAAHRDFPFGTRDVKGGFAVEDWHWACETINAGYQRHVAPGTIIFKRDRPGSRNAEARANRVTIRDTALMRFDWSPRKG